MEQSEHPESVVFLKWLLLDRIADLEEEANKEGPPNS